MPPLIFEKGINLPGFLGVWDWDQEQWRRPVEFPNSNGHTYIIVEKPMVSRITGIKRGTILGGTFGAQFEEPSQAVLKALTSNSARAATLAEELFSLYEDAIRRFEFLLRTTAGLKELFWNSTDSLHSFFNGVPDVVNWWHGDESGVFAPRLQKGRRRINQLFQRKNLVDKATWDRIRKAAKTYAIPSETIVALMRIRSKVVYRNRAIPVVEAAIITERIVREFVLQRLGKQGISRKRMKELQNDLTFSLNSNVFLPLCLTKTEMKKMGKHIEGVNKLRKLRNDVAHSNIGYDDVTYEDAKHAVDAALALVTFLEQKLQT